MSDGGHIPGMGWWPPKLRLERSDLCSDCAGIDFMAAFTPPQDYRSDDRPWTLLVERERLVNDSNCVLCQYFSHICYSICKNGMYFIAFHEPPSPFDEDCSTQHGKEYPPVDTILISVLHMPRLRSASECFRLDGFGTSPDDKLSQNSGCIVCHLNKPARRPRTPQVVPKALDISLAKAWLETCTRHHRACRCSINNRLQMPRVRLIDCVARKLINVGAWPLHRPRFAALSYRWGVTPEHKMEQGRQSHEGPKDSLSNLPLTIEDAISVTKGLGLRYLWVDQYCIDQNNSEEKQAQIQKMDRIYQCAEVAIMAAAGDDCHYGLPGVSKRARQVPDPFILDDTLTFGICPAGRAHWQNGAWHQRGWTFQETYLPRRRLIISDTLVHFECAFYKPWQRENSGGFETVRHSAKEARKLARSYDTDSTLARAIMDWCEVYPLTCRASLQEVDAYGRQGNFERCLKEYYLFVTHYTMRKLSYASDGLNAFQGLANTMQDLHHPVYNIAGVPFMVGKKRTETDHWAESSLSLGLGWVSPEGMNRSDQQDTVDGRFPSWTWGNVKLWPVILDYGRTTKPPRVPQKELENSCIQHTAQLRDIQIEFTSDGNTQVTGLAEYADKSRRTITMSLPQPTALLFKARFVPSHAIGLGPEVENSDEGGAATFIGEFCHDTNGRSEKFSMSLVKHTLHKTKSGEENPPEDLQASLWHSGQLGLLIHDEKFYHDMTASGWDLLLLHCLPTVRSIRLLVIQGSEGNNASRVGIIHVFAESKVYRGNIDTDVEGILLQCFSVERDVRLV